MPVTDDSDGWEDWDDDSGVSSDRLNDCIDRSDAYEKLVDDCELQYAVEKLNSLQEYFMVEAKCDVIPMIRQAPKGIPDSIRLLKELCGEYPVAGELLKIILGSGHIRQACIYADEVQGEGRFVCADCTADFYEFKGIG